MGKSMLAIVVAAVFVTVLGAEKIDGIFGIKLGEKPGRSVEVTDIQPLSPTFHVRP